MSFGLVLKRLRVEANLSLRDLAASIGVSAPYLSRVEHGHDGAPTPDRLVDIARALGVPPLVLVELADQSGAAVASYVARLPMAGALFLEIAQRDLGPAELARLRAVLDREFPRRRPRPPRERRLVDLMDARGIVLALECDDLSDLLGVAATRLSGAAGRPARELAQRLVERASEVPSALGHGVLVVRAPARTVTTVATLVTLARPLDEPSPDGVPISVGIVVLDPSRGRAHLELLARIARLARRGLAETVRGLTDADHVLAQLAALDD